MLPLPVKRKERVFKTASPGQGHLVQSSKSRAARGESGTNTAEWSGVVGWKEGTRARGDAQPLKRSRGCCVGLLHFWLSVGRRIMFPVAAVANVQEVSGSEHMNVLWCTSGMGVGSPEFPLKALMESLFLWLFQLPGWPVLSLADGLDLQITSSNLSFVVTPSPRLFSPPLKGCLWFYWG